MVENFYNPSNDENEEARINPSTGISNFIKTKESKKSQGELFKQFLAKKEKPRFTGQYVKIKGNKLVPVPKRTLTPKQYKQVVGRVKSMGKIKPTKQGVLGGLLNLKVRKGTPIKDRIKVMRFQNTLEKARLRNQIERLKLNKRVENLRKQGILKQVSGMPIRRIPANIYPAFATSEVMNDIDSAFNRDLGGANNDMWGTEEYFDSNDFVNEDFYGNEFDTDPFFHLNIKPNNGSPLLW